MTSLLAVLTIVIISAITPGPNNFILMTAAVRGGTAAVVAGIAGVISGTILLLIVVWAGVGALFEAVPRLQTLLRIAGVSYLVWLGIGLLFTARTPADQADIKSLPETAWGVAGFQLLNPKCWALVVTAVSAIGDTLTGMMFLALMFVVVMGLCLTFWSVAGLLISRWLDEPRSKQVFNTVMGCALIGSAAMLLL